MNLSGMMQKIQQQLWEKKVKEVTEKRARELVQEGLAKGTLPRHILGPPEPTPPSRGPCAVCNGSETQLRYNRATGPLSFHELCHHIWKEEAAKPVKRG